MPVVLATGEAKVGGLLDPKEVEASVSCVIMPLHSSLGKRARLCLRKKKGKKGSIIVQQIICLWHHLFHYMKIIFIVTRQKSISKVTSLSLGPLVNNQQ